MSTAQSTIAFCRQAARAFRGFWRHYRLRRTPVMPPDVSRSLTSELQSCGEASQSKRHRERYCGSLTLLSVDGAQMPHETSWMALTLRTGTTYEGRGVVILRPDGSRRRVLASVSPLYDDAGTVVGAASLLTDITDQIQSEVPDLTVDVTEENAAKTALEASEAEFPGLLQQRCRRCCASGQERSVHAGQRSLLRDHGYSREELLKMGRSISIIRTIAGPTRNVSRDS
jgi:hypothetical protein